MTLDVFLILSVDGNKGGCKKRVHIWRLGVLFALVEYRVVSIADFDRGK